MYRRRLKGYAEIGYTIESKIFESNDTKESIFSSDTYFNTFLNDVVKTEQTVTAKTAMLLQI